MSSFNCCFLTCIQISQEAGQVVWYSHIFKNFPQLLVMYTIKGFGIVNKAEKYMFFWNSLAISKIQRMLAIWSLVPLPFLNPAWPSGSSQFMHCWSLAWRILSITLLVCEMSAIRKNFGRVFSVEFTCRVVKIFCKRLLAGKDKWTNSQKHRVFYRYATFLQNSVENQSMHLAPWGASILIWFKLYYIYNSYTDSTLKKVYEKKKWTALLMVYRYIPHNSVISSSHFSAF